MSKLAMGHLSRRSHTLRSGVILILLVAAGAYGRGEDKVSIVRDQMTWAREFLRTMYPHLANKKYTLSVVSYSAFDADHAIPLRFEMDVGEGPKYIYRSIAGISGDPSTWPKDFRPGPQYPKQLLSSTFEFNEAGQLLSFNAKEPIKFAPESEQFPKFVNSRNDLTLNDAEAVRELKREGAQFTPDDKPAFVAHIPSRQLKLLFGRVDIVSTEFRTWAVYPTLTVVGVWDVKVAVRQTSRSSVIYGVTFEEFAGDLISVQLAGS